MTAAGCGTCQRNTFDLADSDEKGNPLIDGLKVFRFQRQIDEKDFDGARETGQRLLEDTALLGLYKNVLQLEAAVSGVDRPVQDGGDREPLH